MDSWFEPTPVAATVGLGTTGIDAEMEKPARIVGTVTDAASGAAIDSSRVCLFKLKENVEPGCTETDNDGHYSFEWLSGGAYKVWFSPDPPDWEEDDYFQQYYNGKATLAEADSVLVSAGGVASGIDAHLVSRHPIPPSPLSAPAPVTTPPIKLRPKPKRHCRKGQRRVRRRGKIRCVKKAHRRARHRSGRGRSLSALWPDFTRPQR
jgi:hypothetical protein